MASRIFNTDSVGTYSQATLDSNEVAYVRPGVFVSSTDTTAIYAPGDGVDIRVEGFVIGRSAGIEFAGSPITGFGGRVDVTAGGEVGGFNYGIYLTGYSTRINNAGTIWSADTAIAINSSPTANYTIPKITNSGVISGDIAIRCFGTQGVWVDNTGTIESTGGWAFYDDEGGRDIIFNKGTIKGSIGLYGGDDHYDGAGGKIIEGSVNGGDGEDYLSGGSGADNLSGENDDDTLHGKEGADQLYGGPGSDDLYGEAGDDGIYGGDGNDGLYGGPGKDSTYGGPGDDYYSVDNAADFVWEEAGQGKDTVQTSVSFTVRSGSEIETIYYGSLSGGKLTGSALSQTITSYGAAGDTLDGGGGRDTLEAGAGNDTYIVDGGDTVVETANNGTDTVRSTATYTLAANVEKLVLLGSGNINGGGNGLANTVTGNIGKNSLSGAGGNDTLSGGSGDDTLNGGLGADVLTGGLGKDAFLFNSALGGGNIDRISDFKAVDDTVRLENGVFTALSVGTLSGAAFYASTSGTAHDTSDRILYETDTGKIFYDADGTGSAGRVQVALLGASLGLTASDFFVV